MYFLTRSSASWFQWPAGDAVPRPSAQNLATRAGTAVGAGATTGAVTATPGFGPSAAVCARERTPALGQPWPRRNRPLGGGTQRFAGRVHEHAAAGPLPREDPAPPVLSRRSGRGGVTRGRPGRALVARCRAPGRWRAATVPAGERAPADPAASRRRRISCENGLPRRRQSIAAKWAEHRGTTGDAWPDRPELTTLGRAKTLPRPGWRLASRLRLSRVRYRARVLRSVAWGGGGSLQWTRTTA
jgi:hypothetical protein